MSNIKALEKMRELCADVKSMDFASVGCDAVLEIADEIEREIAERYIELPVDVDGVPIHYGDSLSYCGEHGGTVTCKVSNMEYRERSYGEADWLVNVAGWVFPGDTVHVKPRTIEDAISDAVRDYALTSMSREEIAAKYAEEIRGMMA